MKNEAKHTNKQISQFFHKEDLFQNIFHIKNESCQLEVQVLLLIQRLRVAK